MSETKNKKVPMSEENKVDYEKTWSDINDCFNFVKQQNTTENKGKQRKISSN